MSRLVITFFLSILPVSTANAVIRVVNITPADATAQITEQDPPGSHVFDVILKTGVMATISRFTVISDEPNDVLQTLTINSWIGNRPAMVNIGSVSAPIPRIDRIVVDKNIGKEIIIQLHVDSLGDCIVNQIDITRISSVAGH